MLTTTNLQKDIIDIISTISKLSPEKIHENSDILELGLDSLSWLDLLAAVEKNYSIRIPDEDLVKVINVKQLTEIVARQLLIKTSST